MSERIDFPSLDRVLSLPVSKTNIAKNSSVTLTEFIKATSNLTVYGTNLTDEELSMFIKSIQNWMIRRNYTTCRSSVSAGDIFFADLGINYKPETAYPHPIVVIETVGNIALVAPTTTSSSKMSQAYHPIDNPTGDTYLRKVRQTEDGFAEDCAIILTDIKSISLGRLLDKKGTMDDINNANSIFREVKEKIFSMFMPKEYIEFLKLKEENDELKDRISDLETDLEKLNKQFQELPEK
jgi:mRNA-degrading endonuclease toxin of MazEF toxin-antitoxin module